MHEPPFTSFVEGEHGAVNDVGELEGSVHGVKVGAHHAVAENFVTVGANHVGEGAGAVDAPEGLDSFLGLALLILLNEG